jgi:phage tail-like protein
VSPEPAPQPRAGTDAAAPEPFLNMRFRVEIEGLPEAGVLEVVFPEARLVARANGGRARFGTLLLKRGVGRSQDWYAWWDRARRDRRVRARTVTVTLLDDSGAGARRFRYRNAKPAAYALSSLNALGREALVETLELTVGDFEAATVE